ncbi:signal recognition particle-docking protein FtsY [Corynebacterium pygosceleis]|uniref:Signal recognition particle receptor FtsY n=1 Tax=Corynebacterium pygosceleis TaxID=2800406 RepID=A0A9Q4C7D1_9CORY|nr:signal recognition particle-docking protein FtsY [Corynebacterium pygosceleis]MCK7636720.1 signal recognition particle-docking protein FtsY [Corynebacterium pygosceleis]MCK7674206.1 signal recognition particle-docking protein FtsY [Corynebacterium pygosceleis]MCL0120492.1 signal recognition particle-docking protein FtsY [Corynebacterium pygosceleis]MCX7467473.1 signal recognition particle-docking protein FtsY [Corynebacterium pygosceleis]
MDNLQNVMDQFATNPTYQIIAGVVLVLLLVILLIVWGLKRKKAKTISFGEGEVEEPKELTQAEKSGNYTAQGGFNFTPAVKEKKVEPQPVQRGGSTTPEKLSTEQVEDPRPTQVPERGQGAGVQKPVAGEPERQVTPIPAPGAETTPGTGTKPAPDTEAQVEPAQNIDEPHRTPAPPVEAEAVSDVQATEEPPVIPDSRPETLKSGESVTPIPAPAEQKPVERAVDQLGTATGAAERSSDDNGAEDAVTAESVTGAVPDSTEPVDQETTDEPSDTEPAAPIFRDLADDTDAVDADTYAAEDQKADVTEEPESVEEATDDDPRVIEAAAAAESAQAAAEAAEVARAETPAPEEPAQSESVDAATQRNIDEIAPAEGRLGKLRGKLSRSQNVIGQGVLGILTAGDLDEDAWEEIEDTLLMADLGTPTTMRVVDQLRDKIAARGVSSEAEARAMLRETLIEACKPELDRSIRAMPADGKPAVVLVVGVNGTGKTTTTGKLARVLVAMGHNVLLGAADTFRAAAADQLETWGRRVGARTVRGKEGADPASVAFDAVARGVDEGVDVVLVDTAGRLHTSTGLMDQLGKVKRVVEKKTHVDEVLLVLDATVGQNGLTQARIFRDVVDITGVVLTKLDGTAKGGIVFQVQEELGVPVKLVGLGEGADHLAPFEPESFVDALLG